MLLLSDLNLRIQYHQYNFFSFIDYMTLRLYRSECNQILVTHQGTATADVGITWRARATALSLGEVQNACSAVEAAETEEPCPSQALNILTSSQTALRSLASSLCRTHPQFSRPHSVWRKYRQGADGTYIQRGAENCPEPLHCPGLLLPDRQTCQH